MTHVSTPDKGELLADRYRLDTQIVSANGNGHSVWRGTDEMLNRTVTIELQVPGGDEAQPLIDAAVTTGGIGHPNVAGVYDAVNDAARAFVVREWVEGRTLAQLISEGTLSPARTASLIKGVADGVAAIHAAGHAHGGLNPDTVTIGVDGEVTLAGLELTPDASYGHDMRAIGGLLYTALTGHWPAELGPHSTLPDAVRVDGALCSPRQVKAGIPAYLDALAVDLLDTSVAAPQASDLAAELRRYDVTDPELSALTALEPEPAPIRPLWKRSIVPIAAVICIAVAGLLVGTRGLPYFSDNGYPISDDPTKNKPNVNTKPLPLASATILDPEGDGTELDGARNAIDGNDTTSWAPDSYSDADFGGIKRGMGIVVDLGAEQDVRSVTAQFTKAGATVELRTATKQANSVNGFTATGETHSNAEKSTTFELDKPVKARYLLLWITALPEGGGDGYGYSVGVSEISASA